MNKKIRALRDKHGWTNDDICNILNQGNSSISLATVNRWFVDKTRSGYMVCAGHWYDLLIYRLKEKHNKKYLKTSRN